MSQYELENDFDEMPFIKKGGVALYDFHNAERSINHFEKNK